MTRSKILTLTSALLIALVGVYAISEFQINTNLSMLAIAMWFGAIGLQTWVSVPLLIEFTSDKRRIDDATIVILDPDTKEPLSADERTRLSIVAAANIRREALRLVVALCFFLTWAVSVFVPVRGISVWLLVAASVIYSANSYLDKRFRDRLIHGTIEVREEVGNGNEQRDEARGQGGA